MSSNVIDALNATRTIMQGLAPANVIPLQNVYVYPDDYSIVDTDVEALPFMVIQESVGRTASIGDLPTGQGAIGWHSWNMELVLFLHYGENEWPSPEASTAELQHRNWAIAVNDLLARNDTLGDTAFSIGEQRGQIYAHADYLIDHEQWNQVPYWSIRFLVPVTQIYDR